MYDLRNVWDEEWQRESATAPGLLHDQERIARVGIAAMLRAQHLARAEFVKLPNDPNVSASGTALPINPQN